MFLASPQVLLDTFFVALLAYVVLVLVVRIAGKRTLAKWNAFDFVVTVALGSALGGVIIATETPAVQGIVAFAALILFQRLVSWLVVHVPSLEGAVKSRPVCLLRNGRVDEAAMRRERVALSEVRAAVRSRGVASLEDVGAVVLETDGSISVVPDLRSSPPSAMADVKGFGGGAA